MTDPMKNTNNPFHLFGPSQMYFLLCSHAREIKPQKIHILRHKSEIWSSKRTAVATNHDMKSFSQSRLKFFIYFDDREIPSKKIHVLRHQSDWSSKRNPYDVMETSCRNGRIDNTVRAENDRLLHEGHRINQIRKYMVGGGGMVNSEKMGDQFELITVLNTKNVRQSVSDNESELDTEAIPFNLMAGVFSHCESQVELAHTFPANVSNPMNFEGKFFNHIYLHLVRITNT